MSARRTLIEISGHVSAKPYPKSRAGRRTVPLPPFVVTLLTEHLTQFPPSPSGDLFTNRDGGPLWRSTFRSRIWRPALVRAGLLGKVVQVDETTFRAEWPTGDGLEQHAEFSTHDEAVSQVARHAAGGLRFHDLRHTYATWLVSSGVPINDVASVMGHEQTSTTLNRYTHRSDRRDSNVRGALADFSLTEDTEESPEDTEGPSEEEP